MCTLQLGMPSSLEHMLCSCPPVRLLRAFHNTLLRSSTPLQTLCCSALHGCVSSLLHYKLNSDSPFQLLCTCCFKPRHDLQR